MEMNAIQKFFKLIIKSVLTNMAFWWFIGFISRTSFWKILFLVMIKTITFLIINGYQLVLIEYNKAYKFLEFFLS